MHTVVGAHASESSATHRRRCASEFAASTRMRARIAGPHAHASHAARISARGAWGEGRVVRARGMTTVASAASSSARDSAGCFVENPRAGEIANDDVKGTAIEKNGALKGLRVAVKDNVRVGGLRSGAGNPTYLATVGAEPATVHAPCVDRVLNAGAVFVGKTHMDELAWSLQGENFHYGTPKNARGKVPGKIPGGSSSGSASAVCNDLADIAIGTDTIGSVRLPASFCGLYGMRPTHGRVNDEGVVPLSHSFDTVGWFAKNAKNLKSVGSVLLDPETRDHATSARLGTSRFGLCSDAFALLDKDTKKALRTLLTSEGARRVYRAAAGDKATSGVCEVMLSDIGLTDKSGKTTLPPITEWSEFFRVIQTEEVWGSHGEWIKAHRPEFGPGVRDRFKLAEAGVSTETMAHAKTMREKITAHLDELLADGSILILPAARGAAPMATDYNSETSLAALAEARNAALAIGAPGSLARLPCVVFPCLEIDDEPLGVMLMSRRGTDEALLEFAEKLAGAIGLKK